MGELFLMFIGMAILSVIGVVLLLVFKKRKASSIMMVLMGIYTLMITYMNFTAGPSNYIAEKIISLLIGGVGAAGMVLFFGVKRYPTVSKLLMAGSVVGGTLYLFFR